MSQTHHTLDRLADEFGQDTDPLKKFESRFRKLTIDPFEAYLNKVQKPKNRSQSTLENYRYAINRWENHMEQEGRHPACPRHTHVKRFSSFLREEHGNENATISRRIGALRRIYEWWQEHHAFPHPSDYNPFALAETEMDLSRTQKDRSRRWI